MDAKMERFEEYVSMIAGQLGHADRVEPFRGYCAGLMLPGERKSVEPMAARVAPMAVRSTHQRLHHFVADAAWSDAAVLGAVRSHVLGAAGKRFGAPEVLIIDDTGFPKKGTHSVGVARQYCGPLGKQDNCQVAVSLSLANERYSIPVGYQLYLPKNWSVDVKRRKQGKVPVEIAFATKPAIALRLIDEALRTGASPVTVVADAGYGIDTAFRDQLSARKLPYVVGITKAVSLWPEGSALAARPLVRSRAQAKVAAARRAAPTGFGQSTGQGAYSTPMEEGHLAGRHESGVDIALCRGARARCLPRPLAQRTARGRMAAH